MTDATASHARSRDATAAVHASEQLNCELEQDEGEDEDEDEDDRDALEAYARSSDAIVAKSVQRYVGFVRRRKRVVDAARWQLIAEARGLCVYKERVERRVMKSFVSTISTDDDDEHGDKGDDAAAGATESESEASPAATDAAISTAAAAATPLHDDSEQRQRSWQRQKSSSSSFRSLERQGSYVENPSTMVSAFCIGRLRGSLETVMTGLYADSSETMRANCAIQFAHELRDCGVVQTFERASDAEPFAYFGVKWLEKDSAHARGVADQLCWVERMGVHTIASGRRFGYQLLKSLVHLDDASSMHTAQYAARPVNVSLCYIYCQIDMDVVEVFVRGIVEIGSTIGAAGSTPGAREDSDSVDEAAAVRTAGDFILAAVRGRECGRMRTIAQLIDQSKTEREQLTACHCSKVIRGLPKVEMCKDCVEAMRRPKLVDVRELARQTTTIKRGDATRELPRSNAQQQLLLQSRLGSVRHDAEVPESIERYCENQSFRMFLPIRDPRPASSYRQARKERGNVLMQMLRRNANRGSFLPTFLRDDDDDNARMVAAGA